MRVFVVGTGRCGSATFYQACRHITNYTAAHESQSFRVPDYDYPDNHIEISHLNSITVPRLKLLYPRSFFVHLARNRRPCIQSWISQGQIEMRAWARQWYLRDDLPIEEIAAAYYNTIHDLCDDSCDWKIHIETAAYDWQKFLAEIGGEGDPEAGKKEFRRAYNSSENRGRDSFVEL